MLFVTGLWTFVRALFFRSATVALENLALRHQLGVLQRSVRRPRLSRRARILWVWLSRLLFVFVVLRHDRRELVHLNVTDHPTAVWTPRQIIEAFPGDSAPRFLLHDRDAIYGEEFMRIHEILTAPALPGGTHSWSG